MMQTTSKRKKIGIYGPWWANLGCEATAAAMIYHIQRHSPDAEVVIFSLNPYETESRHGMPSYPINLSDWSEIDPSRTYLFQRISNWMKAHPTRILRKLEPWVRKIPLELAGLPQLYRRMKELDAFIVTGGGQLMDFWGGAITHPYWLLKHSLLARLAGAKVIMLSIGAGPVYGKASRFMNRVALSTASYRSYRDKESKEYVDEVIGFKRNDPVYPDLVYSLPVLKPEDAARRKPVVGIGVMAYYDPRHWPQKDANVYQAYIEKLSSFVAWLIDRGYGISFLLGEAYAERPVIEEVIELVKTKVAGDFDTGEIQHEEISSIADLMKQVAQVDMVVATRFHNIVLPTIYQKPAIALSYHPKTNALMNSFGQSRYCLSIDTFEVEALKERFIDLEANCEQIKQQFAEKTKIYRDELEEQYEQIFKIF